MKKLAILATTALTTVALQADTIDWYRFEDLERGTVLSDGVSLVNSVTDGAAASLKVYDSSDNKYKPVAALVGNRLQRTVNDFCPVENNRSLNFQQYGKKNGSAIVVPDWETVDASGSVTPSSFTVETFFKLTGLSVTDGYRTLFAKTGTGTSGQTFRVYIVKADEATADKLYVYLNDTQYRIDGVAATIRDGDWHHLAFAYDAVQHKAQVHFDGDTVLSAEVTLNAYEGSRALYVGSAGLYNTAEGGTSWNCFPGYVDEVRISDKALVADELLRMRPADWTAPDTLDISRTPALLPAPTVTTNVSARLPGLRCGSQDYVDSTAVKTAWQGTDVFTTSTSLSPDMAYKAGTSQGWTANTLWTYSGYIWNRNEANETWTFASCILARGSVFVDGERVVANESPSSADAWGGVKQGSVSVSPGAHRLEIRLHSTAVNQYTYGGGGAYYNDNLSKDHGTEAGYSWAAQSGIMLDRQGRGSHNVADYAKIVDAGDGALLTQTDAPDVVTRTPNFAVSTLVATNGVTELDLSGCSLAIPRIVGTPSFVHADTLTIGADWTLTALPSAPLACDGTLVFAEGATLTLDGFTTPSRMGAAGGAMEFAIARADAIEGLPTLVCGSKCWKLVKEDTVLKLQYVPSGLVVLLK